MSEHNDRPADIRHAFRAVDEIDWAHLDQFLPHSGHGQFWRAVLKEVHEILSSEGAAEKRGDFLPRKGESVGSNPARSLPATAGPSDHTFTPAQPAALRAAAERVCWFDWSGNDMDAIAAMEELRKALASQPSPAATVETTEEIVQRVKEACAEVADRAKTRYEFHHTGGETAARSIAASIRALIPPPVPRSSAGSDDLPERLRAHGRKYGTPDVCIEAAAEIECLRAQPQAASVPTVSAMQTALRYMQLHGARLEKDATKVSGAGEGAEIYRDAAKCIAFALSLTRPQSECGK